MLESETDRAGAVAAVKRWAKRLAKDEALADGFYRANMITNLAGQLFVREIEAPPKLRRFADELPEPTFVDLPFQDAIDSFKRRTRVDPETFAQMSDAERFRSFTISKVVSDRIRDNAIDLLETAMQPDGVGLGEFIRSVRADELGLGFTPSSHGYLENVYRTATATSYNAGRYVAQTDPVVAGATGFWQYLTVDDDRVRDEHAALHGKVWPIGDPEAERVYPPNGYQCRCAVVVLAAEDVDPNDLNRSVDARDAVTEGFSGTPVGAIEEEAALEEAVEE